MSEIIELKKKILIANAKDVTDICQPLFAGCHLNYFHFRRTYKDGSFFWLGTRGDWQTNFLKKNITVSTPLSNECFHKNVYFAAWKGHVDENIMREARNDYDIDNGITITECHKDYYDACSFASSKKALNIIDYYFNNMNVLRTFILYFKDKADKLIEKAHGYKIQPPPNRLDPSIEKIFNSTLNPYDKKTLIEKLQPHKFKLSSHVGEFTLSIREFQCLGYLNKGLSSKEIAKILTISSRTVETYIENIKNKLGYTLKSELVAYWRANQLDFIFD